MVNYLETGLIRPWAGGRGHGGQVVHAVVELDLHQQRRQPHRPQSDHPVPVKQRAAALKNRRIITYQISPRQDSAGNNVASRTRGDSGRHASASAESNRLGLRMVGAAPIFMAGHHRCHGLTSEGLFLLLEARLHAGQVKRGEGRYQRGQGAMTLRAWHNPLKRSKTYPVSCLQECTRLLPWEPNQQSREDGSIF